jgi:hypothetical protein
LPIPSTRCDYAIYEKLDHFYASRGYYRMFNLNGFIDVSNGRPGMLVPQLSSPDTNLPYVQEMDEFLIVKEIIPFLEYENYSTIPEGQERQERSVAIGDRGLIAFRSVDGSIFCSNSE